MNYWLMKSEPSAFGIEDLVGRPNQIEPWDGVRNFQARNMMRGLMKLGDLAFFYHSNCAAPGIVGIMEIVREGYPDHTAFDPGEKYFDPESRPEQPRWFMVDVRYRRHLKRPIGLQELRPYADGPLAGLPLLRRGNRLSIMPIPAEQWAFILSLESTPAGESRS